MALDYEKRGFTKYKIAYEPWCKIYDWCLYGRIGGYFRGEWINIQNFRTEKEAKFHMKKIASMEQPYVTYYDKDGFYKHDYL